MSCFCVLLRVVHIIELVSAAPDHRGSGDMLPDVLVNLSSRSRMSSVRHVVLVLKAQSPVHWHISIQRLHCSIDVIVSTSHTYLVMLVEQAAVCVCVSYCLFFFSP